MPVSHRVIYVGGLGRSGTTLLERLLGELPGVVALGEVVHLWARGIDRDEPCGCGLPFLRCPFWRRVGERAFGGWSPELARRVLALRRRVDRTRRIPVLARRTTRPGRTPRPGSAPPARRPDRLREYAEAYRRLYRAAGEVTGAEVIVDSSKHASLAFCLASAGEPVSVVHMVRDARAVAHSWSRWVPRPEDGSPMTRWRPAATAVHWLAQNLAFHLLARRGVPVTRVRYEDLVDAPRQTLGRLARRLGLPAAQPSFLADDAAVLSVGHTVSGNPMRFAVGTVPLRRDDAWRTGMARRDRWLVTALTWPLLLRYGYRLAGQGASA
ncbi:sulfotransferase [Thermopolyspora flexuosa]|uniref:sulfotransferase n=1 Tax=Thermopolyspora flexuosa TaxID=103836 RepID=UPI001E342910|nr:sulfotransferase [Thermopolyspora flexuosa]